jgi:hypothetical protein
MSREEEAMRVSPFLLTVDSIGRAPGRLEEPLVELTIRGILGKFALENPRNSSVLPMI